MLKTITLYLSFMGGLCGGMMTPAFSSSDPAICSSDGKIIHAFLSSDVQGIASVLEGLDHALAFPELQLYLRFTVRIGDLDMLQYLERY